MLRSSQLLQDLLRLLDAFAWIPGALFLTDVDDLTDVIGIVCADMGDGRSPLGELLVIGRFDGFFPVGENLVELLDSGVPLFGVEAVEGFVVVTAELGRSLAFELRERLQVPEDEVVG